MTDYDEVAVTSCVTGCVVVSDYAVEGAADGVANLEVDVDAVVLAGAAELVGRIDFAGSRKAIRMFLIVEQNIYLLWQITGFQVLECVDFFVAPTFKETGGINLRATNVDKIPGMVGKEDYFCVFVGGVNGVYG